MNDLVLHKAEITSENGIKIRFVYDEGGDVLEIFFAENEPATGIELTNHILLRLNQTTKRVISLTILHFSVLAQQTEYGPRSYPLDNLEELPEALREMTLRLLIRPPVNQFLKLSHFQETPTKQVPLTYVEPSYFIPTNKTAEPAVEVAMAHYFDRNQRFSLISPSR